jgi:hypothetical protein
VTLCLSGGQSPEEEAREAAVEAFVCPKHCSGTCHDPGAEARLYRAWRAAGEGSPDLLVGSVSWVCGVCVERSGVVQRMQWR